jgi:hypothetical protein
MWFFDPNLISYIVDLMFMTDYYVGDFQNGRIEGNGSFFYKGGQREYVGEFKNNSKSGYGKFTDRLTEAKYEGYFLNDKFDGLGNYTNNNSRKAVMTEPFNVIDPSVRKYVGELRMEHSMEQDMLGFITSEMKALNMKGTF